MLARVHSSQAQNTAHQYTRSRNGSCGHLQAVSWYTILSDAKYLLNTKQALGTYPRSPSYSDASQTASLGQQQTLQALECSDQQSASQPVTFHATMS